MRAINIIPSMGKIILGVIKPERNLIGSFTMSGRCPQITTKHVAI
jgi:hypothetical protein